MINDINVRPLTERGWRPGSDLENLTARLLSSAFRPDEVRQQHPIGRYRVDFAWPDVMVALEVDGWHHRSPEGAAHDARRDAALRAAGWLVLRVDDRNGRDEMDEQVTRASRVVHGLRAIGDPDIIRAAQKESPA